MNDPSLQQELFLLAGFLLSSAHGLYHEPSGYGPFRLLDAARRLLTVMANGGMMDPYLERLRGALEEACTGAATDEELCRTVDELVLEYAGELKARLGGSLAKVP